MRGKFVKRILPWIIVGLAVFMLFALAATYCVLRFGFSIDVLDRSGWSTKGDTVRYLNYWGQPRTGWQEIDENCYYFASENGAMVTGWSDIDEARYYFSEDGIRATGMVQVENKTYYFGETGAMVTEWMQLDGNSYYFSTEDGAMAVGWNELDGKRMYFSEEGVLQTGWLTLEGVPYYLAEDGGAVSGWVELDGVRHFFNEDGSAVVGWYEDDTGRYFFGEDGHPASGWLDWERKKYYLNEDGTVKVGWLTIEEDRYYFLPSGRMAIGEVEVDGVSRFFSSTGKEVLMCNPWHAIPEDFQLDLVNIQGFQIDRKAKEPLQQMMDACRAANIYIGINNTYRSHTLQTQMWNARVAERMAEGLTKEQAEAKTGESLAIPGHSEHETGLALDINSGNALYKWMAENCWDFGFILRYPDDRMDITGIIYEPWHFRYVGTELSLELKELGLCMEEYFNMLTEQQKEIAD